jgi:hypothetical protein
MNVILGVIVLAIGVGFVLLIFGMFRDHDGFANLGFAVVLGAFVGIGLGLVTGAASSPPLLEGACYRAVRHTTTTLMPVGKVLVPSTTSGIDLEQIVCPL